MINSIELQMISKILTSQDDQEVEKLCSYDKSYYSILNSQIQFILEHKEKTGKVPDVFTFQAKFEDFTVVQVNEPLSYLESEIKKNKQHKLFIQTYNKLADLGSDDVTEAWEYLKRQCEIASSLDTYTPVDIVGEAQERAEKILEYNKRERIPTGFKEIDSVMYGGLSTVEELLVIVARTNAGKSWVCSKMMESAQKAGFSVLYYSPEMQSSFIGTRFDTWRGHFKNSELHRGRYTEEYYEYLRNLETEEAKAVVVEDHDMSEGKVTVSGLEALVKRYHSKLLVIDGLSYITTNSRFSNESLKYKEICNDLFKLSKNYGCAVVVAVQANRESRENRDENGEVFPNIYNISESDHPARIATQVFALRQLYEQHILEFRLEKSRNAKNTKTVFAYAIDFNSGSLEFVSSQNQNSSGDTTTADSFRTPIVSAQIQTHIQAEPELDEDDFDDEGITF